MSGRESLKMRSQGCGTMCAAVTLLKPTFETIKTNLETKCLEFRASQIEKNDESLTIDN
jgi:hypothetical protein